MVTLVLHRPPNEIPGCGKALKDLEGWLWYEDDARWHTRTTLGWEGLPCGKDPMHLNERRCDRCMKKAGLLW